MTQPGGIGRIVPPDAGWIARELRDLRRRIDELEGSRPLEKAAVDAGAITLTGGSIKTANFDGDVESGTAATAGFALGGTNGNAVANTLSPRNELISNDALVSPITGGMADGTTKQLLLPVADAPLHTETIAVPPGFTQAFVLGVGLVGGQNPNPAAAEPVSARVAIGDQQGDNVLTTIMPGLVDHSVAFFATTVTDLGDTLDVSVIGHAVGGDFSGATARVSAFVIFIR